MTKKETVDKYLLQFFEEIEQKKANKTIWWELEKRVIETYWLNQNPSQKPPKDLTSEYVRSRFNSLKKQKEKHEFTPSKWQKESMDMLEKVGRKLFKENVKKWQNQLLKPYLKGDPNNVLIIGDTHEPFCKEGYLEFCREQQEKYNCGTVVHIGDLVDNHAVSYHEHDPTGKSIGDEYQLALEKCKKWYEVFPNVKICIGNHDAIPFRKAFTSGLPSHWLKSYQQLFESPSTWEWDFTHTVAGVIYQHGTGLSGEMASINCARENRQSTVIGHLHTVMNTRFLASYKDLIFGVSVGCGIDHKAYAFAYGKENTRKPVIACAVVLNGKLPINIPMDI